MSVFDPPHESRWEREARLPKQAAIVVSSFLVEDGSGGLLLGRRLREPHRGAWIPPGGKVIEGEKLVSAGVRELREESGLEVQVVGRPGAGGVFEYDWDGRYYLVVYSRAWVTGGTLRPGDDIDDLRFCTSAEIGGLRLGGTARQALIANGWLG